MTTFQLSDVLAPTHMDFGLTRMQALLSAMGNPHQGLRAIHIAGTNGKGSVAAYLTSILMAGGYSVGTTTSPHLVTERERMILNGQPIEAATFQALCEEGQPLLKESGVTYFEAITALALKAFQKNSVDWAVIEVGMGGRLDATNVLDSPVVTVITSIGLDHIEFLGDSLSAIATEKAGIGKTGVPMIVGPSVKGEALAAIHEVAHQIKFPVIQAEKSMEAGMPNPLLGKHQKENLATALTVMQVLNQQEYLALTPSQITYGIEATRWPARLEVFDDKRVILDGSHNANGFATLADALKDHPAQSGVWLVSLKSTKAIEPLIKVIMVSRPQCVIITTGPYDHGGYHSPEILADILHEEAYNGEVLMEASPVKALLLLKTYLNSVHTRWGLITGSLHTAGMLRPLLLTA